MVSMGGKLVSEGGLEPPSPKATDFKSVVYTVSTTPTLFMLTLLIIAKALVEFIVFLYVGNFILYVLSFGKHKSNQIFIFFSFLLKVPELLVNLLTFNNIPEKHLPRISFLIFLMTWLILISIKVIIGGPESFNIQ